MFANFPVIIPIIQFVLSDECRKVIRTLKRMAWDQTHKMEEMVSPKEIEVLDFGEFSTIYNYWFWKQDSPIKCLFSQNKNPNPDTTSELLAEKVEKVTKSDIKCLLKFGAAKIVATGRIKGASKESILEAIDDDCAKEMMPFYQLYITYSGKVFLLKRLLQYLQYFQISLN